ncbi:MAG: TIR domain-containing protein [Pseudomonadota bacterium]
MAVLFISHSSKDNQLASEIGGWLKANGFNDIFIDQESIAGGDKWAILKSYFMTCTRCQLI